MGDAPFRRILGVASILVLLVAVVTGWYRTADPAPRDGALRGDRPSEAQDARAAAGRQTTDPPRRVMRSGYEVREMSGILGRVGFHDGFLYVENHNRFDWRGVEIRMDAEDIHRFAAVPSSSARRIAVDTPPRTVTVSASDPDDHAGVMAVVSGSADR